MTDDEIKAAVAKYIIDGHESDNADCLHEMDEWQIGEESEQDDLNKAYDFYRSAKVTVTWDQPGEGGVREPRGDSPDNPPAGESRLPGGSDDYFTVAFAGDDPADLWEHITPVSPEEFTRDTRVDWPVIPAGVTYQAGGGFKMWMEPDGSWHQEILPATANSGA